MINEHTVISSGIKSALAGHNTNPSRRILLNNVNILDKKSRCWDWFIRKETDRTRLLQQKKGGRDLLEQIVEAFPGSKGRSYFPRISQLLTQQYTIQHGHSAEERAVS
jgi:hypothetical protein